MQRCAEKGGEGGGGGMEARGPERWASEVKCKYGIVQSERGRERGGGDRERRKEREERHKHTHTYRRAHTSMGRGEEKANCPGEAPAASPNLNKQKKIEQTKKLGRGATNARNNLCDVGVGRGKEQHLPAKRQLPRRGCRTARDRCCSLNRCLLSALFVCVCVCVCVYVCIV